MESIKWFKHFVMSFSFKQRRAKELIRYRNRIHQIENMESDEIDFEYIRLKSKYEYKKSVLTIFMITIILSIWMNLWKAFFVFIEKNLYYVSTMKGCEITKIGVVIFVNVLALSIILILIIMITYMKDIYIIRKELMIVEMIRAKRGNYE